MRDENRILSRLGLSRMQKWADPVTGLSPHFWGRAGMVCDALADTSITFRRTIAAGSSDRNTQPVDGGRGQVSGSCWRVWYQDGQPGGGRQLSESSCSAMFVYTLLKSIRKGYAPQSYADAAERVSGILKNFIEVSRMARST